MYILLTIICKHGAAANKTGSANQRGEKKFEGFFYLQNRNTAADWKRALIFLRILLKNRLTPKGAKSGLTQNRSLR
jgi:hypothetical protein